MYRYKGAKLSVRITQEEADQLEKRAKAMHAWWTSSDYVRWALQQQELLQLAKDAKVEKRKTIPGRNIRPTRPRPSAK